MGIFDFFKSNISKEDATLIQEIRDLLYQADILEDASAMARLRTMSAFNFESFAKATPAATPAAPTEQWPTLHGMAKKAVQEFPQLAPQMQEMEEGLELLKTFPAWECFADGGQTTKCQIEFQDSILRIQLVKK